MYYRMLGCQASVLKSPNTTQMYMHNEYMFMGHGYICVCVWEGVWLVNLPRITIEHMFDDTIQND